MVKHDVKLAYNPKTDKPIVCTGRHADSLNVKSFDKYVRAIYFPREKTLYFRFFQPSGDYFFVDEGDKVRSFDACFRAKKCFIRQKLVPKSVKTLFWSTNRTITEVDTRW